MNNAHLTGDVNFYNVHLIIYKANARLHPCFSTIHKHALFLFIGPMLLPFENCPMNVLISFAEF